MRRPLLQNAFAVRELDLIIPKHLTLQLPSLSFQVLAKPQLPQVLGFEELQPLVLLLFQQPLEPLLLFHWWYLFAEFHFLYLIYFLLFCSPRSQKSPPSGFFSFYLFQRIYKSVQIVI